jgi:hypothetical protein
MREEMNFSDHSQFSRSWRENSLPSMEEWINTRSVLRKEKCMTPSDWLKAKGRTIVWDHSRSNLPFLHFSIDAMANKCNLKTSKIKWCSIGLTSIHYCGSKLWIVEKFELFNNSPIPSLWTQSMRNPQRQPRSEVHSYCNWCLLGTMMFF